MLTPLMCWIVAMVLPGSPGPHSDDLDSAIVHAMRFSQQQLAHSATALRDSLSFPRLSGQNRKWTTTRSTSWTSGFFPGCLWRMFEWSNDTSVRRAAERWTDLLEQEKFNNHTHDIGFMTFCSFGNGYRLTGDPRYREVLLQAAKTLATRFNDKVGCIKSWDGQTRWDYPVITDNMMNLELLFWASKNGGSPHLAEIAVRHAIRTMNNHVRKDGGTYHVVDYDTATGAVVKRQTKQGYADESVWARGQAWGTYGFTMAYRETGEPQFLSTAERLADFYIGHLPTDGVPYWDFNAPDIPDAKRDVSAAAIAAAAFIELSTLTKDPARKSEYLQAARRGLTALCSPAYLAEGTDSAGILNHAVGNMPGHEEVDVSLIYADYYFLEAMLRYRALSASGK